MTTPTLSKTSTQNIQINIRPAQPQDVQAIFDLVYALAIYEKMEDQVKSTPQSFHEQLFGNDTVARAIVAEVKDMVKPSQPPKIVGLALFFRNFSTFLGKPGIYLEDLFVMPEWRGYGIGKSLISNVAQIAVEKGYERFDWSVLDWNKPSIDFYESIGAKVMREWYPCRVTGNALVQLAKQSEQAKK